MNKAIFTVMLLLSFSLTGCIDDGQNDLQPESDVEPTVEPTGAADFDSLERRINELENETEELRYDNDKLGNRIVDLEANNSELMDSYEQLINDYDDLANEIVSLNEQLEELENSGTDDSELLERIALLEQNIADLEEDVEELMLDKSLLYNKLHLLKDINPGEIVFDDGGFEDLCTSGCSVATYNMFDSGYYTIDSHMAAYGEHVFFGASSTGLTYFNNLRETVWISDGTPFGTYKLSDLSDPEDFTPVDMGVFFLAYDGDFGQELAFSDGTSDGTLRVTDDGHNCTYIYSIYGGVGNTLFFGRPMYSNGCGGSFEGYKVYSAIVLPNGEVEVNDLDDRTYDSLSNYHITSDGKFFFATRDYDNDEISLHVAGPRNITTVAEYSDDLRFGTFGSIGGTIYYGFGEFSNETLWKSDGTEEGTFQFKRLHNNSSDSVVIAEVYSDSARDLIYFRAIIINDDGSRTNNLYISDGTAEGTYSAIESTSSNHGYRFYQDEFDDSVYFVAEKDSDYGDDFHFYVFDENSLSFDFLFNETENNFGGDLRLFNSYLVGGDIYAEAGHYQTGNELWKIDIDSEYVGMLHDVNPGPDQSGIGDSFTYNNGKLYFSAFSSAYGGEIWYITV